MFESSRGALSARREHTEIPWPGDEASSYEAGRLAPLAQQVEAAVIA